MNEHAKWLREAAEQIRSEGHAGWGNTCEWAADEIDRLTRERDVLSQDAHRYRFLACKGVPPHSHRWSRWRLECWNGEWWDPLMKEELDATIDAQIEQEKANGSR